MSRSRRSPTGTSSIGTLAVAAALAGILAAAPAAAAGNSAEAKSQRASVFTVDAKKKSGQAMPGPRRPGWVESVIGKIKPRPPKHTCRG
ncbi:hypothetical protein [Cognatilysobacter bugurensis]|uniref:Uncharacterized protein n=1 Tax=Cognatilysobacter bugurensis TaxID=543356 RepID=A0A918SZ35_9GAMM|nr:hypothetical protein [Lysobacter bugurensis]GHA79323.1 hypothetical protein GCM10007067_16010 [Lysobacter bugurensis]